MKKPARIIDVQTKQAQNHGMKANVKVHPSTARRIHQTTGWERERLERAMGEAAINERSALGIKARKHKDAEAMSLYELLTSAMNARKRRKK